MYGSDKFKDVALDRLWCVACHLLPSKLYLSLKFRVIFRRRLNWKNPVTFSEKLQWLKLYGCRPEYSRMVDKIAFKEYASSKIGAEHIIPALGVWDTPDQIDFDALPERFVLKCNHDSGGVIICRDKSSFDVAAAKEKLLSTLSGDYYLMGRETPYKGLRHRILAEEYIEDPECGELADYKVHNFNGEPKVVLVCRNRFSGTGLTEDFYSAEWEKLDLRRPGHPVSPVPDPRPAELDEMLRLSRVMSEGIPFLRTDFYIVNHRVYLGELTFFPSSGLVPFVPGKWDRIFGDWLALPEK